MLPWGEEIRGRAVVAVVAGALAAIASGRPETGYIAFTATVGALLAFSRFLGERPNFSVAIPAMIGQALVTFGGSPSPIAPIESGTCSVRI